MNSKKTFSGLKQEVMDEAEGIKQSVNIDSLEQDISAATKIDIDVNISEADMDIAGDLRKKSD